MNPEPLASGLAPPVRPSRFHAARLRVPLGFVLAAIYVWRARPTSLSLILGLPFVAVGLLVRAYASGHIRKDDLLATSGPYRYTRNPLYLGSAILAAGFVIVGRDWLIAALAVAMFSAVYIPVIRREEAFLRNRFGNAFDQYARAVPRLLPRLALRRAAVVPGPLPTVLSGFSWNLYRRHREYNALVGAAIVVAVLIAKLLNLVPKW